MKIIKAFGKFLGGFLILIGITIFILSYFGSYALGNIDVLKSDISSLGINLDQIQEYCIENPNDENCQGSALTNIDSEINQFSYYGNAMRGFGLVFFISGVLLFIWCCGWIVGLRNASFISLAGIIFSYIYYNFVIAGALSKFLPQEINNVLENWINLTLKQTIGFILVLGAIFLILSIWLYMLNKREKLNSAKKMEGIKDK